MRQAAVLLTYSRPAVDDRRCGRRWAGLIFQTLVLLLVPAVLPLQAAEGRNLSEGILSLSFDQGLLSLQTRDAPIGKVLDEVSRVADLSVNADGPLEGNLTVYIDKQPPETAMKKILRGRDVTFFFGPASDDDSPRQYRLKEVRIFLPEAGQGQEQRYSSRSVAMPPSRARPRPRPPVPAARTPPPAREESSHTPPLSSARPHDEDAQRFVTGLMEGNFDALNDVAQRLKEENPEAGEQIDRFIESLSTARENAQSGNPLPSLQDLGNLGMMMKEMTKERD